MKNIILKIVFKTVLMSLFVGAASLGRPNPSRADLYGRQWHQAHWGEGHWVHDRHGGRLGWWWVIGNDWHFFMHPVAQPEMVIVQQPQPVIIQQPAPQQVLVQPAPPPATAPAPVNPTMYYCRATGTYYPETMSCPNGWTPVVAGAPPAP